MSRRFNDREIGTGSSRARVRNTTLPQADGQSTGPSRSAGTASHQGHYDSPEYEFNGLVLSWQPENIKTKKRRAHLSTLPASHSDTETYYNSFMPHILEETWGMLKQGIEKSNQSFKLTLIRPAKLSKKKRQSFQPYCKRPFA